MTRKKRIFECVPVGPRLFGRAVRVNSTGCLEFRYGHRKGGYGSLMVNRKRTPAHRAAWELANSRKLSSEEMVCHRCDNPPCIEPTHLFVGDVIVNADDMVAKDRALRGSSNPRAKLTLPAVQDILARIAAGEQQKALAREYGVTPQAVYLIKTGQKWKRTVALGFDKHAAPRSN